MQKPPIAQADCGPSFLQGDTPRPRNDTQGVQSVVTNWSGDPPVTAAEIEIIEQFLGESLDQLLAQWQAEACSPRKSVS